MKVAKHLIFITLIFCIVKCFAQTDTSLLHKNVSDKKQPLVIDSTKQRDVIDIISKILNKNIPEDNRKYSRKLNFAVVPAIGYSLSTGFGVALIGNAAFYTSATHQENLSAISLEGFFDTRAQKVLISRGEIWAKKNKFKLVTDLRLEKFPDDTYGLGTFTTDATINHIDYNYVRSYITFLKKITPDFYGGIGYNLDYHYNITQGGNADGTVSDFSKYGQASTLTSSGVSFNLLFDNRRNPINPLNGGYASIIYRENYKFLGSDNNWHQLKIDLRKYLKLSPYSNNILAFWSIAAFTNGNIPYLEMPATGFDMYDNAGRGYKINRFRGKNMLYLESEYRFGITSNGLLGGVVFANAQSLSEFTSNKFQRVAPAAGTGIRVKMNKHSNTNVCLDYAVGVSGSHGFFATLGENF